MPVPPFVAGQVLTAAQLNLGVYKVASATAAGTATTLQVNSCFSADWRHYRILISGSSATAGVLTLQLSASGTAATTSYYWNEVLRDCGATPTNTVSSGAGSTSSFRCGRLNNGSLLATSNIVIDVLDPYVAYPTGFTSMNSYNGGSSYSILGSHYSGASYDGFKLTGAGNLTLDVSVYAFEGGA